MAKSKPYRYPLYLLARAGGVLIYLLPRAAVIMLGRLLGRAGFYLVGRQRRRAIENLKKAYGSEKSETEIRRIAEKSFENLVLTGLEVLQFPKLTWQKVTRFVDTGKGIDQYRELLSEGRGLISITGHIGNWELLAGLCFLNGLGPGAVIARRLRYEPFDRWVMSLRGALGMTTFYRDGSAKELMGLLKQGRPVGMLPDQDIDSLKGVFVDYFGRPAYTTVAPVRLALGTGAPILTNFLVRKPDGCYKMVLGEVIRPKITTTREEALRFYTQAWMSNFEKVIREYPDQWAWMHDRWKTRPETEAIKPLKDGVGACRG